MHVYMIHSCDMMDERFVSFSPNVADKVVDAEDA